MWMGLIVCSKPKFFLEKKDEIFWYHAHTVIFCGLPRKWLFTRATSIRKAGVNFVWTRSQNPIALTQNGMSAGLSGSKRIERGRPDQYFLMTTQPLLLGRRNASWLSYQSQAGFEAEVHPSHEKQQVSSTQLGHLIYWMPSLRDIWFYPSHKSLICRFYHVW